MMKSSAADTKKSDRRMTVTLVLVVVAAVAIALVSARTGHGADVHAETSSAPSAVPVESAAPEEEADKSAIGGEVLEAVPVSKYTYLRLRGPEAEIWAAVPSAVIAIGSRVTIANATRMDDFKSATLGRTFKAIYFGTLGAAAGSSLAPKYPGNDLAEVNDSDPLPPGHPDIGNSGAVPAGEADSDALPSGHPSALGASPHGDPLGESNAALPTPQIAKAQGRDAHTIADLATARLALAGQRVRVRGQVTKVTPDVQGHAFFHIRDGNLSAKGPASDLVVTSLVEPKRGQVATFEGTLRADVDLGIGYNYPVLLENALVVAE